MTNFREIPGVVNLLIDALFYVDFEFLNSTFGGTDIKNRIIRKIRSHFSIPY